MNDVDRTLGLESHELHFFWEAVFPQWYIFMRAPDTILVTNCWSVNPGRGAGHWILEICFVLFLKQSVCVCVGGVVINILVEFDDKQESKLTS